MINKLSLKKGIVFLLLIAFVFSIIGCSSVKEGSFKGMAQGYHGNITVTTEIGEKGEIKEITISDNHNESEEHARAAFGKITQSIIDAQSLDIDVVSGATLTSKGIIDAVADSLKTAGAKPEEYGYLPTEAEEVKVTTIKKEAMPIKQETTCTVTVTDAKGRKVDLDLPISSYAVSTMDVVDFIIPLKGEAAFDILVGSGQDGGGGIQKYGKLYAPFVGNYMEHLGQISDHNAPFDLEMILAMNPDVIIVNSAMGAHKYALEVEDVLNEAGIKIILIDVPGKKLDQTVQNTMNILGKIFGEEKKAAEVAHFIDQQYQLIASKNLDKRTDKPAVYYEKSGYSEVYGSTGTSISGWGMPIDIAGGINIADALLLDKISAGGSNNQLDPEYVIQSNPDFIILSGINDGWLDIIKEKKKPAYDILNRIGWRELEAVKNENVYEFAHSTNRSIFAFYPCLKLAKIFYPDEFLDLQPEEILNEFFDRFMLLSSDITTWFITLDDAK